MLFPLTYKSMQSMNEMRKLQPEIEKLKAKYGDDREKMNVAVMQLYQQHKVNPLGGCLPMLLQMPIWFALYAALQTSVELYREPFLWITDLTAEGPVLHPAVAMGVSSFLMQKLSPQPADNTQAKMMLYFFPIFFTFIMLNVPAGLTLYIFVNNLLSIAQQQVMMQEAGADHRAGQVRGAAVGPIWTRPGMRKRRPLGAREGGQRARTFCEELFARLGAKVAVEVKETPEAIGVSLTALEGNTLELSADARRGGAAPRESRGEPARRGAQVGEPRGGRLPARKATRR